MNYYKIGRNCEQATIAITSNTKFISPLNNIYNFYDNETMYKNQDEDNYKKIIENILAKRGVKVKKENYCPTC